MDSSILPRGVMTRPLTLTKSSGHLLLVKGTEKERAQSEFTHSVFEGPRQRYRGTVSRVTGLGPFGLTGRSLTGFPPHRQESLKVRPPGPEEHNGCARPSHPRSKRR
jgi:hypothetical protein